MNTMDQRYLNFSHALMVSPLKLPLDIELYNDIYLPTNSKHIIKPSTDQASCKIDELAFLEYPTPHIMPTSSSLFEEYKFLPLPIEVTTCSTLDPCPEAIELSGKLFSSNSLPRVLY